MAGHLMLLSALLMQPDPQSAVPGEHVLDLHAQARTDPGEAIDHQADHDRHLDTTDQSPSLFRLEFRVFPQQTT